MNLLRAKYILKKYTGYTGCLFLNDPMDALLKLSTNGFLQIDR